MDLGTLNSCVPIYDTDEDDEESTIGIYEGGHWTWDEHIQGLNFVSNNPESEIAIVKLPKKPPTGTIQFRDNIDIMEQMRFRRRYQRKIKVGQLDVITLQDVKDIALFTAPVTLLSPKLINLLHIPTTERFIRALILCCQYYLQIAEEMANRMKELETKIRTPECDIIEKEYKDNLADIRVLVAKEYCTMTMGGADTRRFHHMGYSKKKHSLSDRDARLFEMLLRMCVQIVWLALGRKSFHQIELEVNRIFKSEIFNATEHNLRTGYISKMSKSERNVLLGYVKQAFKLNTCSPLLNEVMCERNIDYRLLALGVVKYPELSPRLKYMLLAISSPEEELMNLGVSVGILGMHRSLFDIMLHPLPPINAKNKLKGSIPSGATASTKSASSMSQKSQNRIIYPGIVLPTKARKESYFPPEFPTDRETPRYCSEEQACRWQRRLIKLLRPRHSSQHRTSNYPNISLMK